MGEFFGEERVWFTNNSIPKKSYKTRWANNTPYSHIRHFYAYMYNKNVVYIIRLYNRRQVNLE